MGFLILYGSVMLILVFLVWFVTPWFIDSNKGEDIYIVGTLAALIWPFAIIALPVLATIFGTAYGARVLQKYLKGKIR